jgi:hypothetical protein
MFLLTVPSTLFILPGVLNSKLSGVGGLSGPLLNDLIQSNTEVPTVPISSR